MYTWMYIHIMYIRRFYWSYELQMKYHVCTCGLHTSTVTHARTIIFNSTQCDGIGYSDRTDIMCIVKFVRTALYYIVLLFRRCAKTIILINSLLFTYFEIVLRIRAVRVVRRATVVWCVKSIIYVRLYFYSPRAHYYRQHGDGRISRQRGVLLL